jgi:hypothetical protein
MIAAHTIQLQPLHALVREAILDQEDRWPDMPEDVNRFDDNYGCPDREPEPSRV